jgi:N-acetylmuramoyl-L-alanine amidase
MKKLLTMSLLSGLLALPNSVFAYTIQPGDTVSEITSSNKMTINEFKNLNPQVTNINQIIVGQNVYTISPSDRELLTHLVYAEATDEPYAGHVAVASVVLNRMVSGDFPDTVGEVINQVSNGYYQFTPVRDGRINLTPDAQSYQAVDEALTLKYPTASDSLFFYNPKTATSRWLDSRPTTVVIGNTVFKK